jgi:hypothetical protein
MAANPGFYQDEDSVALTSSFVSFPFHCIAGYMTIFNDDASGSTNELQWSWDGVTVHGSLKAQQKIEVQDATVGAIWLRFLTGAPDYKIIVIAE